MKAILNYHGFTKMVDMPHIVADYDVILYQPARAYRRDEIPSVSDARRITFRFMGFDTICGEKVGIYKASE